MVNLFLKRTAKVLFFLLLQYPINFFAEFQQI